MQSVGPGSVDKPMIDMATPQAERSARSQGGKRLTEAFESMPANKKSRLSVARAVNDTDSLLNDQEDEGTDSLLNADEVSAAGHLSLMMEGGVGRRWGKESGVVGC